MSQAQFEAHRAHCQGQSIAAADAVEQQAERFESGGGEIVGAGIGGMLASKAAQKRQYASCMTGLGYRQ